MKKEANYIEEYQREMLHFGLSESEVPTEVEELQYLQLLKEFIDIKTTQFEKRKNKEKWIKVESFFYPFLCNLAKLQGGCAALDIDEETWFAQLTYSGKYLLIKDMKHKDSLFFLDIMANADDVIFSLKENCFEINFMFELYDKVKIEDHSEELAIMFKKLQHYQMCDK